MSLIGYARVSTKDQNLQVQLDKLAHCEKLFTDQHTGTSASRPGFDACMAYVREGDTLLITRLDRLARSTLHLCQITDTLRTKGVDLQVLDQHIDTSTSTGRLLFNMLGAIGQFETEIRKERQLEGIAAAKLRGIYKGRPTTIDPTEIQRLYHEEHVGASVIAKRLHIGRASVYRALSETRRF